VGFRASGLGCRGYVGFGVQGIRGVGIQGLRGVGVEGLGLRFRIWVLGLRVQGLGFGI
jgi:hypothetical protein